MTTQQIETLGSMEQAEASYGIIDLLKQIFGDDPEAVAWPCLLVALGEGFASLQERERSVLFLRYGLQDGKKRTLKEVGAVFGLTRERIRQIESKALRKLRHPSRSRKLREAMLFNDFIPIEGFTEAVADLRRKLKELSRLFGLTLEQLSVDALLKAAEREKTRETVAEQIARLKVAGVNVRIIHQLQRSDITKPLGQHTDEELLKIRNFGARALEEIRRYYPAMTR